MKKIFILMCFLLPVKTEAQSIVQTWIDPCTNTVQTATFPLNGIGVTVVYRNQAKTFTAQQAAAGELIAWINQVTISTPCPIANNPVVQQTATQTATQAATQAASTAASAAASSAASSSANAAASGAATSAASSTPTPTASTSTSSSAPSTSSSGEQKTETKTETKSESKSESKSEEKKSDEKKEEKKEEKKDEKKKNEAKSNPIMIASDLTIGQNPDKGLSEIITVGVSQSSLMGDKSYGATGMLWSTFDQGALSLSYTKMNFKKGKLKSINSYSSTSAYLKGVLMQMLGYTWVKPHPRFGVYGVSVGAIGLFMPNGQKYTITDSTKLVEFMKDYSDRYVYRIGDTVKVSTHGYNSNWATSAVAFWMHPPIVINPRLTVSPQVFVMGSPVSYNSVIGFTTNKTVGMMIGDSWDYKITRRFGATAAHRIMIPASGKPLNFLLIGSRMIL